MVGVGVGWVSLVPTNYSTVPLMMMEVNVSLRGGPINVTGVVVDGEPMVAMATIPKEFGHEVLVTSGTHTYIIVGLPRNVSEASKVERLLGSAPVTVIILSRQREYINASLVPIPAAIALALLGFQHSPSNSSENYKLGLTLSENVHFMNSSLPSFTQFA
ncbi:hypothetical protein GCM10007116_12130 [Sulfodiicoccus acidiphilus]|nr:hypothetical protein GCM10007116_12130 [Sulfodiicoccus acidiphilus]